MIDVFEKENNVLRELLCTVDNMSYREFRKIKIPMLELIESTITNEIVRMIRYSEILSNCVIKNFDFGEKCVLTAYDGKQVSVVADRKNFDIHNLILEAYHEKDISRVVFYIVNEIRKYLEEDFYSMNKGEMFIGMDNIIVIQGEGVITDDIMSDNNFTHRYCLKIKACKVRMKP